MCTYEDSFRVFRSGPLSHNGLDVLDKQCQLGVQGLRRAICLTVHFSLHLIRVAAIGSVWQVADCQVREVCEGQKLRHGGGDVRMRRTSRGRYINHLGVF